MTKHTDQNIAEAAEEAFWSKVADMRPDITTGAFPPDASFIFTKACEEAVATWIISNKREAECCGRVDCQHWLSNRQESDHQCAEYVAMCIEAQLEELDHQDCITVLKEVLGYYTTGDIKQ